jgi:hypothetical protein
LSALPERPLNSRQNAIDFRHRVGMTLTVTLEAPDFFRDPTFGSHRRIDLKCIVGAHFSI